MKDFFYSNERIESYEISMKRGVLRNIIEEISRKENIKYKDIADKSNIGRTNMSTIMNNEPEKEVSRRIWGRVADSWPAYFENYVSESEKIDKTNVIKEKPPQNIEVAFDAGAALVRIMAVTDVLLSAMAELLANQQGRTSLAVREELEAVVRSRGNPGERK